MIAPMVKYLPILVRCFGGRSVAVAVVVVVVVKVRRSRRGRCRGAVG